MVHLVPQQQPWAAEKCVEYKAWHHPMLLHLTQRSQAVESRKAGHQLQVEKEMVPLDEEQAPRVLVS
jgi:hypothetical protein